MSDPASVRSPSDPPDSFEALVRAHYGRLCDYAYRLVQSRDAAETACWRSSAECGSGGRVWQRRETFDVRDPLPYLYQAVRHQAATYRRHQGVRERWRKGAVLEESNVEAAK